MTNFANKWSKPQTPSIADRINDTIKPKGALKPRVENAIKKLQTQNAKMEGMLTNLKQRVQQAFQKIVAATQQHDSHATKVLANELVEVRKVTKVLGSASTALQQIELRLTTFHTLGDTVVTIMPTIGLMKGMKSSLAKFMPGAEQELSNMAEMLGGLMGDSFSEGSFAVDSAVTNEESEKILQEAAAVAEASLNDKLPSMPVEQTTTSTSRYL